MEIEASGAPVHTRTLVVALDQRDAGHVTARGTILDLRKRGLVPMAGDLQPAGVIHDMRVEALVAMHPPRLVTLRAEQPSVAFEPSLGTGGECCRDPARRIEALADTPLDDAAARQLGAALGGPRGCSHVLTLAQLLLSTARTALALDAERHAGASRAEGQCLFHRSLSIDGFHAAGSLHLALQLADVHLTPTPVAVNGDALERLAARLEVRAAVEVGLETMTLRSLRAAERAGDPQDLYGPWRDRSDAVADLQGRSALAGMASALLERLGTCDADRPLLDALLNVAPVVIQSLAAVMEPWRREPRDDAPSPLGVMVDTCYMWRREGTLYRGIEAARQTIPDDEPSV